MAELPVKAEEHALLANPDTCTHSGQCHAVGAATPSPTLQHTERYPHFQEAAAACSTAAGTSSAAAVGSTAADSHGDEELLESGVGDSSPCPTPTSGAKKPTNCNRGR